MDRWTCSTCLFVLGLMLGGLALSGRAIAADGDEVLVPNAAGVFFDRVAPKPGTVTAPAKTNSLPLSLTYSGSSDGDGSGIQTVTLWVKNGATGTWTSTGKTSSQPSGTFQYGDVTTDGQYYFALRAEDLAGNASPAPSGAGDGVTLVDRKAPILTLLGNSSVLLEVGATYQDAGATAKDDVDGDLTSQISVDNPVDTSKPGLYVVTYAVSDSAGNAATPVSRTVTVESRYVLTLEQPSLGSISANPAPGTNGQYMSGTVVTLLYTPSPLKAVDITGWTGATMDATNPSMARVTMDAHKTVSVSLVRQTGSVDVRVSPTTATWKLTDGDAVEREGAGSQVVTGVPTGNVSIVYLPITNMTTPGGQSAVLSKGGTVTFRGEYVDASGCLVSLPDNLNGAPGEVVLCPINLSKATDVKSYRFQVTYDAAVVDVLDVRNGSLNASWPAASMQKTTGSVTVSGSGAALGSSSGSVVILRLQVKQTAKPGSQTALALASTTLNSGAISAQSANGALTVSGQGFLWGDANGDGVIGDVDASLILQYRVGLVEGFPSADAALAADVSGSNPSKIGTLDASMILSTAGKPGTTFRADVNGDTFGPDTPLPAVAPSGALRSVSIVNAVEFQPGAQHALPVNLSDGRNMLGYYLEVAFEPNAVEFLGVEKGSLTTTGWTTPVVMASNGRVAMAAAGTASVEGGGSLALLHFRALPNTTTAAFAITAVELNDGEIPSAITEVGVAPSLTSITPNKGASAGGTVVRLAGANLSSVTDVFFGTQPAPWFGYDAATSTIQTVSPAGSGVVDVTVMGSGGEGVLSQGFTYFAPSVFLTLNPAESVNEGSPIDVPITLDASTTGKVATVSFRLRYDRDLFAARRDLGSAGLVTANAAAINAGKQVTARVVGPGEIAVTIAGNPSKTMQPGPLCTIHLMALGESTDATGLIYITDTSATGTQAKNLTADGGIKDE